MAANLTRDPWLPTFAGAAAPVNILMSRISLLIASWSLPLVALAEPGAAKPAKVDFRRDVLPVLSTRCFHCHGPDEGSREAKLRLDVREDALKDRDGFQAIVPGNIKKSEMIVRITSDDEDEVMPPKKHDRPLTAGEVDILKRWIESGADYELHWSFVKPKRAPLPEVSAGSNVRNAIDHFVAHALPAAGLSQSPEADRFTLLRRVSLDLTGLPPTPAELEAFAKDAAPDAYERAVDRLLASTAYGEKWARMWLDLARFADSSGYGSDQVRMNMWPYRDWVISAFNRNVPYDRFSLEQLAGDLLPNATMEQVVATAFHRNTMTQNEGGTDDEEYRVAAVKDRVGTTMQTWMGLTANCAQCHTHKFDPISHKEYYQLFAIFNQTEDADRADESPKVPLVTKNEETQRAKIQAEITALEAKMKQASPQLEEEMHGWEAQMAKPVNWQPLAVSEALTREGKLESQADGSLKAPAQLLAAEKYTLKATTPLRQVTAFRLEVLPEKEGGQVGRSPGNAVLTEFQVSVGPAGNGPVRGRYVRIEHQPKAWLQIAEVQALKGAENAALKGKATQSTVSHGGSPEKAIDGKTDGVFDNGSVIHNAQDDPSPWWEVDLGADEPLDKLVVWNRAEVGERIIGARVIVLDGKRREVFSQTIDKKPKANVEFEPAKGIALNLETATATYAQSGFGPEGALDGKPKTGWAFAGATDRAHTAVFALSKPVDLGPDTALTITLRQDYGGQHNLARFRLTATDQAGPVRELPENIRAILALEPSEREQKQREELLAFFGPMSKAFAEVQKVIDGKRAELAKIKPVELPIMKEKPANAWRKSHVLAKGNFMAPTDEVKAGLPVSYGPLPAVKGDEAVNRLTLARWILNPENPLTARVAVNRFWAQIFGVGLTETEEDFGTQGQFPSHPELLDWLAVAFQSPRNPDPAQLGFGWDVKALLKFIVTSHTYRQSSKVSDAAAQKDTRNRYLSHYPRRRLEAEAIRDQAMALSGLLSRKFGGPSVYPPQPDGLWSVAFNGGQDSYPTSKGEDRYRRGLYTFWRRIAPNPTMVTFDAPSREICTIRRVPTNTPLQAFVTLNDPVFVECAQALARRVQREAKGDVNARLKWALQLVLGRPALDAHVAALKELYDAELLVYRQNAEAAKQLATGVELPLPANADPAELAAWTVVANVLLNLDGVLMKS
jgi:mono/diheme cytochrome c family protein